MLLQAIINMLVFRYIYDLTCLGGKKANLLATLNFAPAQLTPHLTDVSSIVTLPYVTRCSSDELATSSVPLRARLRSARIPLNAVQDAYCSLSRSSSTQPKSRRWTARIRSPQTRQHPTISNSEIFVAL